VKRRIVLIGFTATGKSSVGRRLATRLGWPFVDTDAEIVQQTGKTIREIFHGDGEEAFRSHERRILKAAARRSNVVIASGGGAVLIQANRALIERTCFIVCLEARPQTIYQRLRRDLEAGVNPISQILASRPDAADHIAYLKQYRQPYYAIAHWTVHTDNLSPDDVVEEIVRGWQFYDRAHAVATADSVPPAVSYPLGDARESDAPYSP
jgi:shikimate kinase